MSFEIFRLSFEILVLSFGILGLSFDNLDECRDQFDKKTAFAVIKCNFMLLTWLKNLQNGTCVAGILNFEQKS